MHGLDGAGRVAEERPADGKGLGQIGQLQRVGHSATCLAGLRIETPDWRGSPAGPAESRPFGIHAAPGRSAAQMRNLGQLVDLRWKARDGVEPPLPPPSSGTHAIKPFGIGMSGCIEHVGWWSGLDNAACIHDRDPVAELCDDAEIVGDEHQRHVPLAPELVEERQHLRLHGHVQRGRWFVRDDQIGSLTSAIAIPTR